MAQSEPSTPEAAGRFERLAVVALLMAQALLLANIGRLNSPTWDEVGHLPSGVSHWLFGRFDLYRVNPPLVRSIAAAPVVLSRPKTDWRNYQTGPYSRSEFTVGVDFLNANGPRAFWLFTLARWALIPFVLLGGWVCYRWARELYGPPCGLLALLIWCFEPNVLGNGAMITPDACAASTGCLANYAFWLWLKRPVAARAAAAGISLGVAELTKTTWVVLYALWPLVALAWHLRMGRSATVPADPQRPRRAAAFGMIAMTSISIYIINCGYLFRGTLKPLGSYSFISRALVGSGPARAEGANRFAGTALASVPVPLPEDYVRGIDVQRWDFERGLPSYLAGVTRKPGWWYYYLYASAVKLPLGMWLLGGLACFAALRGSTRVKVPLANELVLLAPAAAVFLLVSSQTGINRHYRYVLPAIPYAIVYLGKAGHLMKSSGPGNCIVAACALLTTASSLAIYPHSLSYFNEAAGGPLRGHEHLLDSNIDWGQDLLALRRWADAHPEARSLRLAYFGSVPPQLAGLSPLEPPPGPVPVRPPDHAPEVVGPQPGWYAVSVNLMAGYEHHPGDRPVFAYFSHFEPVDRAGYSILIYNITCEAANQVRTRLGLPTVPAPP